VVESLKRGAMRETNDVLLAMADTRRFTGTGRLKTILDAMACWRMKLLHTRQDRDRDRDREGRAVHI